MRRRWIKIFTASLAFLPLIAMITAVAFNYWGVLPESVGNIINTSCGIFYFPVFILVALIKTFNVSKGILVLSIYIVMILWSSFIAWFFWKVAGTFQGEDEPEFETNPEKVKFDWVRFRVRFYCGFVVGFLGGLRVAAKFFANHGVTTTVICMVVCGFLFGFLLGIARPPDFWSRS